MMNTENTMPWLERLEDLIQMLEGSTIAELELTEAGTQIIIRRQPGMVMVSSSIQQRPVGTTAPGDGASVETRQQHTAQVDKGVAVTSPMTGVYYESAAPTEPPFVKVNDVIHAGQVIALIEAMKVFNEIQADVSGRVIAIEATNGSVVQKGAALLRVQPV